ncbi:MAG TPA: sigma 54-interacting transcriptional regulator, partial [Thermoanaerobaculia bacterium]|nr:sigma 54-interacting transcriptional regulator [Thermoanaerobaculia bacterium]
SRLEQLEPEERPALQAHAGDWEGALREAAGTPFALLWRAVAAGEAPPAPAWEALDGLEPYRAARLVFDLEILVPGAAPVDRLRQAAGELRALGALPLAERLEERDQSPWQALAAYCGQPPGNAAALAALLAGAGHSEARLVWRDREEREGSEGRVIVAGAGGEPRGQELVAHLEEGWLALRGEPLDAVLRALFTLAARDLGGDRADRLAADPPEPSPAAAALPEAVEARRSGRRPAEGLVGESPALLAALERAARLAAGDMAILVLGESGTGKELIARHIHRASPRARLPFVAVNCAALSDTLLLSDLFGHVRGAFTGADRDRAGVFEAAQGGTVFLDEIGDLPAVAQGMLLRVLQEGEVRRVGESLPRKVNVRVVAATHRDLRAMIGAQSFREDLYYRLRGGLVELPPLRDRGDDILLLADSILSRLRMPHTPRLSREARASLLSYPWPGNVRELQNVLGVAAALAGSDRIRLEHLDLPTPRNASIAPYHQRVEAFRRHLIEEALTASGGSLSEAARRLGLSRQALSYLVKQLGLK